MRDVERGKSKAFRVRRSVSRATLAFMNYELSL